MDVDFARQVAANRAKLERYEALCKELGEEPASWRLLALHIKWSPSPVSATARSNSSKSAVRARKSPGHPTCWRGWMRFPGPGGEGARAYSW